MHNASQGKSYNRPFLQRSCNALQQSLILDTSFRISYCFSSETKNIESSTKDFDVVARNIFTRLGIDIKNLELVSCPLATFEFLRFGSFNSKLPEDKKKALVNCLPKPNDLLTPIRENENLSEEELLLAVHRLDESICKTYTNIYNCYRELLSPYMLIEKIDDALKLECIFEARKLRDELLNSKLELEAKSKQSQIFERLCILLAWDRLSRYTKWTCLFDEDQVKSQKDRNNSFQISEREILIRLAVYYFKNALEHKLAASIIFTKFADLNNPRSKPNGLYGLERNIFDNRLTEYACSGYPDPTTKENSPVIALTCDQEQKNRVSQYLVAKIEMNRRLKILGQKESPIIPGLIIIVQPKDHSIVDIIDIKSELDAITLA